MVAQFKASQTQTRPQPAYAQFITKSQWATFEGKVADIKMEPEEFLAHWNCTYDEIAKICQCSRTTVANWFCKGKSVKSKRPTDVQKMWLGTAHKLLHLSRN